MIPFTYRIITVFIIHLALIITVSLFVISSYDSSEHAQNETHLIWCIFFVIDFPCAILFQPIIMLLNAMGLISPINYFLDCVIWPALYFLIVGTMNWIIICELLCLSKRFHPTQNRRFQTRISEKK